MSSRASRPKPKSKKVNEPDPLLILKQKFRTKCRFRAIGRLALANAYWLLEDTDVYEGVENVKRRVAQAMRKKKKQLLKPSDKALLNKPAEDRTEEEKRYIYRIIGGLKCFKKYPNHVKKKLAAVTYFQYYGPNRVIIRQHQEGHALYFIVSGDVSITQDIFDGLLNKYVPVEIVVLHAGDLFGEISLLHNIPRTATCTTLSHCQLLSLKKGDFSHVLKACLQKLWEEVRLAMGYFTYFDALDDVALREGCIMAKLKTYSLNDTILGDGEGVPNHVYFVISGSCQMIESLDVITTHRLGRTSYTLYDPHVSEVENERMLDSDFFGALINLRKESSDEGHFSIQNSCSGMRAANIDHIQSEPKTARSGHLTQKDRILKRTSILATDETEGTPRIPTGEIPVECSSSIKTKILYVPSGNQRESIRYSLDTKETHAEPKCKTYFMQVCRFNPGSSFGFGENMRDRRIMALSNVHFLLLPKVWLLQHNTANIWTRIKHYLDTKIPNKRQLFKFFVEERKWHEYKEQIVNDVVARANTVNSTSVHDVPYSIRMEEMIEP